MRTGAVWAGQGRIVLSELAGCVGLVWCLAHRGCSVIALDTETNPNLGISLGAGGLEIQRLVVCSEQLNVGEI